MAVVVFFRDDDWCCSGDEYGHVVWTSSHPLLYSFGIVRPVAKLLCEAKVYLCPGGLSAGDYAAANRGGEELTDYIAGDARHYLVKLCLSV